VIKKTGEKGRKTTRPTTNLPPIVHQKNQRKKGMANMNGRNKAPAKASDRGGKKTKTGPGLDQDYKDGFEQHQECINEEIQELKDSWHGKVAGLKEWNKKINESITALMERVSAREDAAKRHDSASVDGAFDAKMDKFVKDELAAIVEAQVKKIMMGQELQSQVANVVKTLLGQKGKDDTILLAHQQLCKRGMLKNVKDLMEKKHYRILINKYVPLRCCCC